jgi:hypothetical protein
MVKSNFPTKIGEICEKIKTDGHLLKNPEYWNGDIPFCKNRGFNLDYLCQYPKKLGKMD